MNGCKKLDMASTVNLIVLHFKNMEALDIGDTDISVLPEGDLKFSNLLVAEWLREPFEMKSF